MNDFKKKNFCNIKFLYFEVFDELLFVVVFFITLIGIITLYSASISFPGLLEDQLRNVAIAFMILWIVANVPPQTLLQLAVPIYIITILLLVFVAMFGIVKKGSQRWLNIVGIILQPSEFMKIAMPLMLSWYFQKFENSLNYYIFLIALFLLVLPVFLIIKQPDLGTGLLIFLTGLYVFFFAGISWKILTGIFFVFVLSFPIIVSFLHDYQRQRIMMLIDPVSDPLGKGFHIIQSVIAIGSGGFFGKGWLMGTQAHLEFIPERTTDFIFSVYSEEFGFFGNIILLILYFFLICRGLVISINAPTLFTRLLSGSITMTFFTYVFVNIGMVSGIIPVVGVPLPLISYGGTSFITLSFSVGVLMSIQYRRTLLI